MQDDKECWFKTWSFFFWPALIGRKLWTRVGWRVQKTTFYILPFLTIGWTYREEGVPEGKPVVVADMISVGFLIFAASIEFHHYADWSNDIPHTEGETTCPPANEKAQ